jgi:subtilisin family serine protease
LTIVGLAVLSCVLGVAGPVSAAPTPTPTQAPGPAIRGADSASAVPGEYIVVFKDTPAVRAAGIEGRAHTLVGQHQGRLMGVWHSVLHGFGAAMSEAQARALAADPDVAYVEQNQRIQVASTQDNPPSWGLDRIDQHALPLDNSYSYDPTASNVTAYVVDSGIHIGLADFGGRARYGWDFVGNKQEADDCNGHGTHVAGTIGGTAYGVAKNVNLVAVRVFACDGTGNEMGLIHGLEWVVNNAVKPAVVNLSWQRICVDINKHVQNCPTDDDLAVTSAMSKVIFQGGLPEVVSAGNSTIDGCGDSFDRVVGSIVVGATDATDAIAGYSNWGACLDLFAPGTNIVSDFSPNVTTGGCAGGTTCTLSGTSMAAPHVTGAIAQLLSSPQWASATPAQIKNQLQANMVTTGVVTGLDPSSPNKLLYLPPPPAAGGSSIALAPDSQGRLNLFAITPTGSLLGASQNTANATTDWSSWSTATTPGWYAIATQTNSANLINLRGLNRSPQSIWDRSQLNATVWSGWRQIPGLLNSAATALNSAGKLEWFGTNSQGQAFSSTDGPNGATAWTPVPFAGVLRSVAAERNVNNVVELFALDSTQHIWHCWETSPSSGTFTPWLTLDGQLSRIAVARNSNGLLEVFGTNSLGQAFHRSAGLGVNAWLPWAQFNEPFAVGPLYSMATETNADGRVEVFAVNFNGQLWHSWQTTAGSLTYSAWTQLTSAAIRP